jgi:hypothetical protein
MKALRPSAKSGIVLLGLFVALMMAWLAVAVRQHFEGPDALASQGMYAFGEMLLGVAVFGVLALCPIALGLYWLRSVGKFWAALVPGAMLYASTGLAALGAILLAGQSTGGWMLLAQARFGLMPLGALALLVCACFAPQARHRWLLGGAAFADGAIFAAIVLVHFVFQA